MTGTRSPDRGDLADGLASDLAELDGLWRLEPGPAVLRHLTDRFRSLRGGPPVEVAEEGGRLVLRLAAAGGAHGPALGFSCSAADAGLQAALAAQCRVVEETWRRGGPARGVLSFCAVEDAGSPGSAVNPPDLLVFAARTENQLATSGGAALRVRIVTTGGDEPEGDQDGGGNAILRMARVLDRIDIELGPRLSLRHDGTGRSSLAINRVEGGRGASLLPDLCRAELERRLLRTEEPMEALDELRDIVEGAEEPAGSVRIEAAALYPAFETDRQGVLLQTFRRIVLAHRRAPLRDVVAERASGGRWLARGGDSAGFGPGRPDGGPVPPDQTVDAVLIQLGLVEELLGFANEAE